jgi:hypothetical protein
MLRSLERNEDCRYIIRYLTDFSEESKALNKNLFDNLYSNENNITNDEKMLINMLLTLFRDESQSHNSPGSGTYKVNKDCMKMLKKFMTYHYNCSNPDLSNIGNQKNVDLFFFQLILNSIKDKYTVHIADYLVNGEIVNDNHLYRIINENINYFFGNNTHWYILKKYLNPEYINFQDISIISLSLIHKELELLKLLMNKCVPWNNPYSDMNNYFYLRNDLFDEGRDPKTEKSKYINILISDKRERDFQETLFSLYESVKKDDIDNVIFILNSFSGTEKYDNLINGLTKNNVPLIGNSCSKKMTELLLQRGARIRSNKNSPNFEKDLIIYNRIINRICPTSVTILLRNGYMFSYDEISYKTYRQIKWDIKLFKEELYIRLKNKCLTNDLLKNTIKYIF